MHNIDVLWSFGLTGSGKRTGLDGKVALAKLLLVQKVYIHILL